MATPEVHICADSRIRIRSSLPGRHRVWVAGLYHNAGLEQALERGLLDRGLLRRGAAARNAQRALTANLVTGTLLVRTEQSVQPSVLVQEITAVLEEFSARSGTSLEALEARGRLRPVHLALDDRTSQAPAPAEGTNGQPASEPTNGKTHGRPAFRLNFLRRSTPSEEEAGPGETQPSTRWHTLDVGRVSELWRVDPARGLEPGEAAERLLRYRRNEIERAEGRSGLALFMDQFKDLPVLLLAGSAVLSCATGGIVDGAVILAVIVLNGAIGYITESSAERTIASLTHGEEEQAEVLREGRRLRIPVAEVVPGDLIRLRMGSVVPADARLLEVADLSVDESSLTGESLPVNKTLHAISDLDLPLGERTNMVYRATLVTGGSATAVVISTGAATEVGKLQALLGEVSQPETPMQRQLRELGERTVVIAGVVCGGVFIIGLLRGHPMLQMLRTAVSLAVAAVPEGLPTVAITTLAIGIQRMKQHKVIVRRLDAIETLGSVQVLCFDKTGTITQNHMRVVQIAAGARDFTVSGPQLQNGAGAVLAAGSAELEWLLRVGALCSDVVLVDDGSGGLGCEGSPTEKALVQLALEQGQDVRRLRAKYPTESVVQRSEQRRMMATIHRVEHAEGRLVAVKGSPLEVLELCQAALRDGEVVALTEDDRRVIRRQNDRMSGDALRVLALAYGEHAEAPDSFDTGLVWLGLMGLADPPREGLNELIGKFRTAGVRSVMITGDQSATAYAVAKQIGLDADGELQTLDAIELDQMSPELLGELVPRTQVFSRVSPRHKLRIVQALQAAGYVVAMTGDGVNDCPALKAADIGVAMGGGKSPVARQVADVILETDDLHAMLVAIEQGRVIHADIKKAVRFILATNLSEILLTFLSVAAGFGESMSPLQLLWINLVSDIFPELALALQPSEDDVLERPPREHGSPMFSKEEFRHMAIEGSVLTAGALAVYTYAVKRYGLSPQARSLSFITLTTAQLLHAFSSRSERHNIFDSHRSAPNPYVPLAVGGGIALTLLIQFVPATRRLFGSRPMPAVDWLIASLGAAAPLVANEITKAVRFSPARARLPRATLAPRATISPRN